MNRQLLISYAEACISFILRSTRINIDEIKTIYLFGSVARGDFDKESDVDIFIDTDEKYEDRISKFSKICLEKFYKSDEFKKFKLMGIENDINIMAGEADAWELKNSVKKDGLILYSSSTNPSFKKYFILEIHAIENITKRNRIMRKITGRNEKSRKEKGIIYEIGGKILGPRHFIVPSENISKITKILSKENAIFRLTEIWM